MRLLIYAFQRSPALVAVATALGLVGGALNAWLVTVIGQAVRPDGGGGRAAALFAALAVAVPVCRYGAGRLLIRFSQHHLNEMATALNRRVVGAPLRSVEKLGSARLLATLTDDLPVVTNAVMTLPVLIASLAVVAGCLIYLAILSHVLAAVVMVCIAIGVTAYAAVVRRANTLLRGARHERDALLGHYRAVTDGITELKLNQRRRETFLTHTLRQSLETIAGMNVAGLTRHNAAAGLNHAIFFAVVGMLLFGVGRLGGVDRELLFVSVLLLLYLRAPLEVAVNWMPGLVRAEVALRKYEQVVDMLPQEPQAPALAPLPRSFRRIELERAVYAYESPERERFETGPIDLAIEPGEILFVTGGNGSGKTTLAKIVAGLYAPDSGRVRLDGETVTDATRDQYRQLFSGIFADFHLFRELPAPDDPEALTVARAWLQRLRLDDKVEIRDGTLSTLALSAGQRKRLALLLAILEDRPVYIFDEWAADQDAQSRDDFYRSILPELRIRQKAVVVISHDDRYYDVGDRLIKLDRGRMVPTPSRTHASSTDEASLLIARSF